MIPRSEWHLHLDDGRKLVYSYQKDYNVCLYCCSKSYFDNTHFEYQENGKKILLINGWCGDCEFCNRCGKVKNEKNKLANTCQCEPITERLLHYPCRKPGCNTCVPMECPECHAVRECVEHNQSPYPKKSGPEIGYSVCFVCKKFVCGKRDKYSSEYCKNSCLTTIRSFSTRNVNCRLVAVCSRVCLRIWYGVPAATFWILICRGDIPKIPKGVVKMINKYCR